MGERRGCHRGPEERWSLLLKVKSKSPQPGPSLVVPGGHELDRTAAQLWIGKAEIRMADEG